MDHIATVSGCLPVSAVLLRVRPAGSIEIWCDKGEYKGA